MSTHDDVTDPVARQVLDVWMGDGSDSATGLEAAAARWFANDTAFDDSLRRRFGAQVDQARDGELDDWADSPRTWLALLILLDQFPRNIHRGTALSFAADEKARTIALAGLQRGFDQQLSPVERVFAYLPFEHGETLPLQDLSVRLFTALREEAPAGMSAMFDTFLDYAEKHRDVIARFGRFPHRNRILHRRSTPEEEAYLAQPGAGF